MNEFYLFGAIWIIGWVYLLGHLNGDEATFGKPNMNAPKKITVFCLAFFIWPYMTGYIHGGK